MSDSLFIVVVVGIGILFGVYFGRMARRHDRRGRDGKNPVRFWLKGRDKDR